MIVFLPHCGFLSEVSRAIEIARALEARGATVCFAARGGPYARLIGEAGFELRALQPAADDESCGRFLEALLSMGKAKVSFFGDEELSLSVASERAFLEEVEADLAVTGFTLTAYLSTRLAGVPLATDHGGSFVPPVLAHGLCPAPVNPPDPRMARLPRPVQRRLANLGPALLKSPVAQLNAYADALGVERLPGMMGLMCGDLTMVTEVPEVLGLSTEQLEGWKPRWPFRVRTGTTFRFTGPLYARLDAEVPEDVEAFLSGDEPVVYLAPTSVNNVFLRALVMAAKASGVRLLVGGTVHGIGDLADGQTLVAGVLPNHIIMTRAAAVVIMGGQGSVQTAVASGTPFVGIPHHGEQELNIAVAERLGMAIRLSPSTATTSTLDAAIRRLLDEPSFASSAATAARHYDGVDGGSRAADTILRWLSYARGAGPPHPLSTSRRTQEKTG